MTITRRVNCMICTAVAEYGRHLTFFGLVLTTFAALLLVVRATILFEWAVRGRAYWTFSALRDAARKHAKIAMDTTVPALLEGSEIVAERLDAKRKGAFFGLRPAIKLTIASHDKMRSDFRLPHQSVEWPGGFVRSELVEHSWREVEAAIARHIKDTPISDSRWVKFAVIIFLAGSALQLSSALPWC